MCPPGGNGIYFLPSVVTKRGKRKSWGIRLGAALGNREMLAGKLHDGSLHFQPQERSGNLARRQRALHDYVVDLQRTPAEQDVELGLLRGKRERRGSRR